MTTLPFRSVSLTSFVGREHELEQVAALLRSGRLLTLTGAGGSGKTRLARAAAERVQDDFAGGVGWVPLASLELAELVPQQIAGSLDIAEAASRPVLEAVIAELRDRTFLLVLDDCEHLAEAVAGAADDLLRACPDLTVLATSREALGIPGERAWLVPPLSLPPAAPASATELMSSEAARLFVDRARDALPSFGVDEESADAVAHICRRLDGIPLAIELAAARVRVLTPTQIAHRLDDAFRLLTGGRRTDLPRHRTLRATMDWSYQLLPSDDRMLLQRLSVFSGGCTLEAAEAVCSDAEMLPTGDVLERMAALVDRSMVGMRERGGSARYVLLETVRIYAREKLEESGPEASGEVRSRHARHFLALAESSVPRLERLEQTPDLVAEFEIEHDNFREALIWAGRAEPGVALGIAAALWWFWVNAGHWREGARWLETVLTEDAGSGGTRTRATRAGAAGWSGLGTLRYLLHDLPGAREAYERATDLWRALSRPRECARALALLGQIMAESGKGEEGRAALEEAVALARDLPEEWILAWTLACHGHVCRSLGRLDEAEAAYAEAEGVARDEEAPGAWILEAPLGRALVAMLDGDPRRAAVHALAAVRLTRTMARPWYTARTLLACGAVAARGSDAEEAARLLGAVSAVRGEETPLLPHERRLLDELSESLRAALGEETFAGAWARGGDLAADRALAWAEEYLESRITSGPPPAPDLAAVAPTIVPASTSTPATRIPAPATRTSAPSPLFDGRVPDLRVRALGPLEIHRSGLPLPSEAWQYARPRELFLYLLCHPQGRTREQVGLDFWPEASTAQVKNNFHVALHRVRRVLGDARSVVLEVDRYRLHPELDVELDAERFEHEVTAAVRAFEGGGPEPVVLERLAEALALYRGDFLDGEDVGAWADERRDRLRRLFVKGQGALGEAHFRMDRLHQAAEAFERLVLVDPLTEEAYRRLMICRARLGDRTGALRLHQRLQVLLRDELDAEPEPETDELARRLRENRPV